MQGDAAFPPSFTMMVAPSSSTSCPPSSTVICRVSVLGTAAATAVAITTEPEAAAGAPAHVAGSLKAPVMELVAMHCPVNVGVLVGADVVGDLVMETGAAVGTGMGELRAVGGTVPEVGG